MLKHLYIFIECHFVLKVHDMSNTKSKMKEISENWQTLFSFDWIEVFYIIKKLCTIINRRGKQIKKKKKDKKDNGSNVNNEVNELKTSSI